MIVSSHDTSGLYQTTTEYNAWTPRGAEGGTGGETTIIEIKIVDATLED